MKTNYFIIGLTSASFSFIFGTVITCFVVKSEPEPEQHIIVEGLGNGYVLTTDQQIKECEGVPEGKLAIISTKQLDDYVRVEDTSMSEFVKAFNRGDFKYEKIRIDPGGTSEPGDN